MPRPQTDSGGIFFDIPRKQVMSRKIPPESPPLMPFPGVTASGRPEGLPFAPTPGYSDKGFLRNRGGISWRIIPGNYGGFGGFGEAGEFGEFLGRLGEMGIMGTLGIMGWGWRRGITWGWGGSRSGKPYRGWRHRGEGLSRGCATRFRGRSFSAPGSPRG